MRIAVIANGVVPSTIGGTERQAWELSCRLVQAGHSILLFSRQDGDVSGAESREGVEIVRVATPSRKLLGPLQFPFRLRAYVKAICKRAGDIDALLCFSATPGGLIGSMVKKRTGLPYCISVQGADWNLTRESWLGRRILDRAIRNAAVVAPLASLFADEISEAYPSVEVQVIPTGTDMDNRTAQGDSIIFVGNLLARKGVQVLVEALGRLEGIQALIAGDGPMRKELEQKADGKTEFLGRVEPGDVKDLMVERGRLLVFPSIGPEGLPNVLAEAMSVGLPVIGSDVPGVRQVLGEGRNGILVPPDDAEALAEAIRQLWEDEGRRQELASAGKDAVKASDWTVVVASWQSVLESIIAPKAEAETGRTEQ